jgi:sphingolipid delta-4 desaturase
MDSPRQDFLHVSSANPHLARMRQIMAAHPEVKELFGPHPLTALYALLLIFAQGCLALALTGQAWWLYVLFSYFVGATINHALFVIVHECTHNLVFKRQVANRILALIANFPQVFPSSMQFFKYHMLHHTKQSEYEFDADLAYTKEAAWVGNSRLRKALSLFFFSLVQGMLRPTRLRKSVKFYDTWFFVNVATQTAFLALFGYFAGWHTLIYFFFSTLFALGLHPLGGRWIQEHYVVRENQETNSYYGPLNKLCFNMGYHNEHHDFMKVAWPRLPKLRALAPEYYDSLFYYKSWLACLKRFIFDKNVTFFDRYVRPSS